MPPAAGGHPHAFQRLPGSGVRTRRDDARRGARFGVLFRLFGDLFRILAAYVIGGADCSARHLRLACLRGPLLGDLQMALIRRGARFVGGARSGHRGDQPDHDERGRADGQEPSFRHESL